MRICHVAFNFFPGRGLTIFYEFAREQARQGIEVSAIAPGRSGERSFEVVDGVRVHRIPVDSIGRFSLGRMRFLLRAAALVHKGAFDLVHTYAFFGCGALPLLAGKRTGPWLYDCQTSAIKAPLIGLQNWLIRAEACTFDAVTALSTGIRDIVFGTGREVAGIVPLGANFEHFLPLAPDPMLRSRYAMTDADCVFVYCGTLDHNRRISRLVEAFAAAVRAEPCVRLLIVGEGSALDELKAQARVLGVDHRITFTGYVAYAEIPRHLSLASAALAFVPIEPCFEHQPPTKTVEYLAQGLPVIATDTAGNRVFVQHEANGLLCRDTPESCAEAMLFMVRNAGKRRRMAEKARDSVRAYEWAQIVRAQVLPIYRKVVASRLEK